MADIVEAFDMEASNAALTNLPLPHCSSATGSTLRIHFAPAHPSSFKLHYIALAAAIPASRPRALVLARDFPVDVAGLSPDSSYAVSIRSHATSRFPSTSWGPSWVASSGVVVCNTTRSQPLLGDGRAKVSRASESATGSVTEPVTESIAESLSDSVIDSVPPSVTQSATQSGRTARAMRDSRPDPARTSFMRVYRISEYSFLPDFLRNHNAASADAMPLYLMTCDSSGDCTPWSINRLARRWGACMHALRARCGRLRGGAFACMRCADTNRAAVTAACGAFSDADTTRGEGSFAVHWFCGVGWPESVAEEGPIAEYCVEYTQMHAEKHAEAHAEMHTEMHAQPRAAPSRGLLEGGTALVDADGEKMARTAAEIKTVKLRQNAHTAQHQSMQGGTRAEGRDVGEGEVEGGVGGGDVGGGEEPRDARRPGEGVADGDGARELNSANAGFSDYLSCNSDEVDAFGNDARDPRCICICYEDRLLAHQPISQLTRDCSPSQRLPWVNETTCNCTGGASEVPTEDNPSLRYVGRAPVYLPYVGVPIVPREHYTSIASGFNYHFPAAGACDFTDAVGTRNCTWRIRHVVRLLYGDDLLRAGWDRAFVRDTPTNVSHTRANIAAFARAVDASDTFMRHPLECASG